MNNLYLIGYRGTGKSTLAPLLAAKCGWAVVEMDDLIQSNEKATIAEIFAQQGEAAFRDLETQMLRDIASQSNQVISTGGGIVLREENRTLMRATGTVVWLQASPKTIFERLTHNAAQQSVLRPALTSLPLQEEITKLVQDRSNLYAATSHFSVDTETHKLNEVVDIILQHLNQA